MKHHIMHLLRLFADNAGQIEQAENRQGRRIRASIARRQAARKTLIKGQDELYRIALSEGGEEYNNPRINAALSGEGEEV